MSNIFHSLNHSDRIAYNTISLCLVPVLQFILKKSYFRSREVNFNAPFKVMADCDLLNKTKTQMKLSIILASVAPPE